MVSGLNFMSIWSASMQARAVKRIARHITKAAGSIEELNKHVKLDIQAGDIKKTKAEVKERLELYQRLINEIERGIHKEQIIFMSAEKDIHEDRAKLTKLGKQVSKLSANSQDILKKFIADFNDIQAQETDIARRLRQDQINMETNFQTWVRYWSLQKMLAGDESEGEETGEARLGKAVKRLADRERTTLKEETELQKKFITGINKTFIAVRNNAPAVAEKALKEIADIKLKSVLKEELQDIWLIIHDLNIVLIHFINLLYKEFPKELEALAKAGFPQKPLHEISEEFNDIKSQVQDSLHKLMRMAKYQHTVARREAA